MLQHNPQTGRIKEAIWRPSSNYDARPHPQFVNALIIHAISLPPGQFDGQHVEDFFCNKLEHKHHPYFESIAQMRVSSHFYIKRDGQLVQFVSTYERAWHAGDSNLHGLNSVNDFAIGIELAGCDEQPFCIAQYDRLIELSKCLLDTFPAISKDRIVGHSEIAPTRKTDPGPFFNWQQYKSKL